MKNYKERKYKRHSVKIDITHSLINKIEFKNLDPEESFGNHHKGILKNISKDGLYFETANPCIVGSKIYVSLLGDSEDIPLIPVSDLYTGIVVWCMKNDSYDEYEYKVGLRFNEL